MHTVVSSQMKSWHGLRVSASACDITAMFNDDDGPAPGVGDGLALPASPRR